MYVYPKASVPSRRGNPLRFRLCRVEVSFPPPICLAASRSPSTNSLIPLAPPPTSVTIKDGNYPLRGDFLMEQIYATRLI